MDVHSLWGTRSAGTWVSELLLGCQWKPDQLSLYQFSARPQCSVVKQGFGLSQHHLVWTPGSAGRIFFRDLRVPGSFVCCRGALAGWPVPWWMGRVRGRCGVEWFVTVLMPSVSAEGAELCGRRGAVSQVWPSPCLSWVVCGFRAGGAAACEGAWAALGERSDCPWRAPVLSWERRVAQGSVQDFSPLNPGSPRRVFSQMLPASARVAVGRTVAVLEAAGAHTQMLLSWRSAPSGAAAAAQARWPSRPLNTYSCSSAVTGHLHGPSHLCSCGTEGHSTNLCCPPGPAAPRAALPTAAASPSSLGSGSSWVPAAANRGARSAQPLTDPADTWVRHGVAGEVPE